MNISKRHFLFMLVCCLLSIVGLVLIVFFKVPINVVLMDGLIIFCPLATLLMMTYMDHEHKIADSAKSIIPQSHNENQ